MTYIHEGTEGSTFYDDFIAMTDLRRLSYLKLVVHEPEGNGFNRVLVMEFRLHGVNEIMIQGSQEAWVTGRAVIMENFMEEFSDAIRDTFVRFAGPIQILLFMGFVIIVTTNITMMDKLKWAAGTFVLVQILPWFVQKFFPRAIIVMGEGKTHWFKRGVSRAGNWLAALFIASLSTLITKYWDQIIAKIDLLIIALIGD